MEPHWLEHALLAIPIGFGASLIYALLHYALPAAIYNYATVAWVGGVFYYLGSDNHSFRLLVGEYPKT